jgi:hypothetical protein
MWRSRTGRLPSLARASIEVREPSQPLGCAQHPARQNSCVARWLPV